MTKQEIEIIKIINREGIDNMYWDICPTECTAKHYTGKDEDDKVKIQPNIGIWYKEGMYCKSTMDFLKSAPMTFTDGDAWSDDESKIAVFPITTEEK